MEVLLRKGDLAAAVVALKKAHPYEEPAFDLYPLLNKGEASGLGRIGVLLAEETTLAEFAAVVKERLGLGGLRYVGAPGRRVRKVALCGGSGASLLRDARKQGADVLVTGDVKYHEARDAEAARPGPYRRRAFRHRAADDPGVGGSPHGGTGERNDSLRKYWHLKGRGSHSVTFELSPLCTQRVKHHTGRTSFAKKFDVA